MHRVLFVRTDRLGETLLTLPALHAIRQAYPDAHLLLLVHPALRDLFADHPDVNEVVAESQSSGPWWLVAWRTALRWRSWHPDTVIISNPKRAYHLGAWLAGIPERVGWDRKWGWLLTRRLEDRKHLGDYHEVEYNLLLVGTLRIPALPAPVPWLPGGRHGERTLSDLLSRKGIGRTRAVVAVHPWTSNPNKQWPMHNFQALIHQLAQQSGLATLVIGGPEERAHMDALQMEPAEAVNCVGALSLPELADVLRQVHVLVTNDSGPMHMAAAVGTPVVALFGTGDSGSHPRRWGPWGTGHTVIHKPLNQITVDEVARAVMRYTASKGSLEAGASGS